MCDGNECTLLDLDPAGGGACPVQWEATLDGRVYYIRYRHSWLTITADWETENEKEVFAQALAPEAADDGFWSDEETNVFLHLISDAIRENRLSELRIPERARVRESEHYCRGRYPRYVVRDERGNDVTVPASELHRYLSPDELAAHVAGQEDQRKF